MRNIAFVYPTTKKEDKMTELNKSEATKLTIKTEKLHDGWVITKPTIEKTNKRDLNKTT